MQVLQVNVAQMASRDPAEELKRIKDAAVRLNPWLMSAGAASEQSQVETTYGSDVEEEANSYFQRIYIGQLSINNVVDMLQRFNMAPPDSYMTHGILFGQFCLLLFGQSDCEELGSKWV
jgi:CCR4-NOT transcription complex subunit 1